MCNYFYIALLYRCVILHLRILKLVVLFNFILGSAVNDQLVFLVFNELLYFHFMLGTFDT